MTDKELKRAFESPRGQLKSALFMLIWLVLGVAVFAAAIADPLGWLDGAPEVRSAKKWIVASIFIFFVPGLAGVWFMVIRPMQTGIVTVTSKHRATYLVLRSEDPNRFRSYVQFNCFLLVITFALGIYVLVGLIGELKEAQKAPARSRENGSAVERLQ